MKTKLLRPLALLFLLLAGCSDDDPVEVPDTGIDSDLIESLEVRLNPTGYAPLSAELLMETSQAVTVVATIRGRQGTISNVVRRSEGSATRFEIDIFGLYADFDNQVEIALLDGSGNTLETQNISIQTGPLIADLPQITIDTPSNASELELNFVNYFGFAEQFRPQRAFIFDQFGDIRWYLDFSSHPSLNQLFYDNGMTVLRNGHLLFGDGSTGSIYETDLFGRIENSWSLQGNGFHHHVVEKPDGNLLVTINDASKNTIEDVVIEIDRNSGQFTNTWDLNNSLDNSRRAWPTDLADLNVDWFHANFIEYSAEDDEIIVSGRTQGIVKLNRDNEVTYILAPHRDWNTSGDGADLGQFLLTPLDANDNPITDLDVLEGISNHPDFEWSWYQHSPILMPNGNLMVFDNGDNRNYVNAGPYSRAVEYEIDAENKTIKQVWSYGKERGQDTYARIVSKVSYLDAKNSILFTPGSAVQNGLPGGKVIEVDYPTRNVIFEATIQPPNTVFNIGFHNVLRVALF